ncbi:MAG: ribonuclease HII [Ruminococcaceae bacterium]|nr:ribonuclease HII [Oscillospiraceae bacterium]
MTNEAFDASLREQGYACFCGVDEAGRGPLAGPVYAAAVILSPDAPILGINDSKKLSEKKREQLFDIICQQAVAFSVASASVEEIERLNILQATFLAMRRAVEGLGVTPDLAAIDGNKIPPGLSMPAISVVKGDALSAAIGAASVLAKVSRDRVMKEMDAVYPGYGFAVHKGYGTVAHINALRDLGPCPIHRPSFLTKILGEKR